MSCFGSSSGRCSPEGSSGTATDLTPGGALGRPYVLGMKARNLLPVSALLAGLVLAAPASAEPTSSSYVEGRLLAPCCYQQTLDIHESELARDLRAEIDGRVAKGESAAAIEEDMVARYGERVRAVPKGAEPRGAITVVGGLAVLGSLAGVLALVRRWSRRSSRGRMAGVRRSTPGSSKDVGLDLRIDAELRALDEA